MQMAIFKAPFSSDNGGQTVANLGHHYQATKQKIYVYGMVLNKLFPSNMG